MIHHEMLAVVNLQCTVSGVVTPSRELLVNHEFNLPETGSSEALIKDMIGYIKEHDNPVTSSAQKSKDDPQTLHNMKSCPWKSEIICSSLMPHAPHVHYETFRSERFVTKQ